MANYELSAKAAAEVDEIYVYSIESFGIRTARIYLTGMHRRFELLADNPSFGRDYSRVLPGLRRYEHRSHSIYYLVKDYGILILRILGAKQDPALHISDEDLT